MKNVSEGKFDNPEMNDQPVIIVEHTPEGPVYHKFYHQISVFQSGVIHQSIPSSNTVNYTEKE